MSLDDIFNKKSRKKSKNKISTQELFEKIIATPQQVQQELESRPEESHIDEFDEWEPIINDDIEPDLSNMEISDLAAEKTDDRLAIAENTESITKSSKSKVVWGGKPVVEETIEEEEPKEESQTAKTGAYVPLHLRAGGAAAMGPIKAAPNLESSEEFPTLDVAITQEKQKKNVPKTTEPQDNSWTEASQGHRINDSTGVSRVAPAHLRRDDADAPKYSSTSSYRENLARRVGAPLTETSAPTSSPWVRGAVNSKTAQHNPEPYAPKPTTWTRGATTGSSGAKPYVIPTQRNILSFTQENRYAKLDES